MPSFNHCSRLSRASLLALPLLGVGLLGGAATPGMQFANQDLQAVLRELRELRRGYYAERDERALESSQALDTVAELRSDVGALESKRAELLANSEAVRDEVKALREESKVIEADEASKLDRIKSLEAIAKNHVTQGIPYRVEQRLGMISAFADSERASIAFGRMWSFCEEELRASRNGETYSDEIVLPDGRVKHARFVRVGMHVLGFVTEDGADVGLWLPGQGWLTGDALTEGDAEAVRVATEVLDRRRGPQHVVLPVPISNKGSK